MSTAPFTDTDALTERIAQTLSPDAWEEHDEYEGHIYALAQQTSRRAAAAVLPIVAVEVRKAKAEAWREYAAALEAVPDYAPTEYDKGRVDQRHATIKELYVHATEYETGDSDERR